MLNVGDKAPDFTLMAYDRSMVTLSEHTGNRIILAFYPAAFTGVCTTEICTFSDSLTKLSESDTIIFGISADNVFANKIFAEQNNIKFPLLCDVERTAIKAYGVDIENFGAPGYVASQRSIFVIEEDGSIGYVWIAENPGIEPKYSEVFDYIKS
ncbi:MAG: peroxiredoxin [Marine Group II euryarchaeote MED-G38]|nr:peroxiredoxin [Euryarchaeota archaeon]OUV25603.1 MAG: peroxiredoxin [Euryarchaeota archaeon TMED97]PDH23828.1 MAG: peroxiredoxin [Marine Group II euryarchaeote MED-G38]|tara:strand:+ start:22754 stop:23215 length:462 start_codon:yes stop_codon:yes gene_type:complete